ncbi:MAG: LysR family transcriptional regulator [Pseudodonghicola sp.]
MIDRRMRHVIAVAQHGSFTAAANVIGVTQSAVTKSVADLEKEIGYEIFVRTPRGAILTEEGWGFVERATWLLEETEALLAVGAPRRNPFEIVLRIGVAPATLESMLVEPLVALLRRYPKLHLEVAGSNVAHMVQQIRNGVVDVAFGFEAAFQDFPDLQVERIADIESALFVRKGHPLLIKGSVSDVDLSAYSIVILSDTRPYTDRLKAVYQTSDLGEPQVHIIDYFPLAEQIVATSDAIGVVSYPYAQSLAFRKKYERLKLDQPLPRGGLCCAYPARRKIAPATRAFINSVKKSSYS